MKELTDRELGTVLAALRYWQTRGGVPPVELMSIAAEHGRPLSEAEIDQLCMKLNTREPSRA